MNSEIDHPFEAIENAHQYIGLLIETIEAVTEEVKLEVEAGEDPARMKDAMRIVLLKLSSLSSNMRNSSRILNDLRMLRRMLLSERREEAELSDGPYIARI